ncbi:aspartate carbamoyltransferase regulatory subunit [Thalassotalea eurytherma]|uniref:Aspartate carbamoyltransferase regulatory chain n=1 Tax=Thalassotalea eurytherma TaxID=1144278 RepID=A0ABQ6H5A4_9GAMM|nr:aspartate carbamoyltransferase regulatory subunit [Thalassotalea eurytherma]GLX83307.1 aspartate carbamoyltransferase regulatory chain [Thalassotalea eurytherma]
MTGRKLKVEAIASGTVIDHIPAGMGIRILNFFELTKQQDRITVGLNLKKSTGGKKDLIKVENTKFTKEQAQQLALFAQDATINVIEDYKVVEKFKVTLPEAIEEVLSCPNTNCITHDEPVSSTFYIKEQQDKVALKCHYCEKSFHQSFFKELV